MRIARSLTLYTACALALGAGPVIADNDWQESKWGPDDRIGAANHLTPDVVLDAAQLITEGKTYSLGMVLDKEFPAFGKRFFDVTIMEPRPAGQTVGPNKLTSTDDVLHTWLGIGSQIDGLGHIGIDHVHYNGVHASEFVHVDGLKEFGVENIPPIVTRGVLLDMAGYLGEDMLNEGTAINGEEIRGAAEAQGVEIREGDVVLLHTGWSNLLGVDGERFAAGEPGLGVDGARYLAELGVVAVGADNWGLEVIPFEEDAGVFEVHQVLLVKHGVYILENIETRELLADEAWEFLFVLGQPKIAGAVQVFINPVAIR